VVAKKTPKKYKLNIFDVLDRINKKDRFYYRNLSDEDKKGILPVVLMRWLTGTKSPLHIELVNKIVNPVVFDFYHHPELQWFLLTLCGSGGRYKWMKARTKPKLTLPIEIIKIYYGYSTREAMEVLPILSNDDIIELAEDLGKDDKLIKELKKELKKR